jgi:hypothetical protein
VNSVGKLIVTGVAGASAAAWTCGKSVAIAQAEATAKALAEATAVAISLAYASCEVNGGFACAFAATSIEESARAVAKAYATLWAGAYTCKNTCSVSVDAVAQAVGSILVKAATDASAGVCTGASVPNYVAHMRLPLSRDFLACYASPNASSIPNRSAWYARDLEPVTRSVAIHASALHESGAG